jgi:hypothetical protein
MRILCLKLVILGVNVFVSVLVGLNIRVQWRAGYNKFSWSSLFLGASLVWLALKMGLLLRWLEPAPVWTDAVFYSLYWLPTTLQCVVARARVVVAARDDTHAHTARLCERASRSRPPS